MPKPKKTIDEMIREANAIAADEAVPEDEPDVLEVPTSPLAAPSHITPEGMKRIRILTSDHTDGKAKKTWAQNSVVEIDQYTAARMIAAGVAAETTADVNEILLEYKGKK